MGTLFITHLGTYRRCNRGMVTGDWKGPAFTSMTPFWTVRVDTGAGVGVGRGENVGTCGAASVAGMLGESCCPIVNCLEAR